MITLLSSRYCHFAKKNSTTRNAKASTNVLRFNLRVTSYREQHLQISQVYDIKRIENDDVRDFFLRSQIFDFRFNLKR